MFRIAVADRMANLPLMKVSDRLTDTAELILAYALDIGIRGDGRALRRADVRRGAKRGVGVGFAVVGYGKLGGLELGYGSDLDLIFLHDSCGEAQRTAGARPVDNRIFMLRLVQKLINLLSIQTR